MTEFEHGSTEALDDPAQAEAPVETSWLDRRFWAINWEQTLYLLFIVLAIASRFVMLGARVQSHDESLHTRYSWELYDGQGFSHNPMMHGPFLFHAAALSYWLFGDSDASARVPVAILGVILVAFPYLLRRQIGRTGALAASFMFLISPSVLYYSRYIRMDIPVILFSMVVVWAMWGYMQNREEKYLYWFAAGLSLMFATKEVSFLYVAIFGSFVALRLLVKLLSAEWAQGQLRAWFQIGLLGVVLGGVIFGGGMLGQAAAERRAELAALAEGVEAAVDSTAVAGWRVVRTIGGAVAGGALVIAVIAGLLGMRSQLRRYPSFDLVVLFSTLLLPFMAPVPIVLLGNDPLDYSTPGMIKTALVLAPMIALAVGVGLWWNWRRWLGAAGVFYLIFAVLFTTVFTNGQGVATGWVGSLGYWIAQQEVERGSQPGYFYLFVVPIYEYLPLLGAVAAGLIWVIRDEGLALIGRFILQGFRLNEKDQASLVGFVPFMLWWGAMTWIVYSYAGEKMGWLTVHFAVPMILLAGWSLSRLFKAPQPGGWGSFWKAGAWALAVLLPILIAALWQGVGPLLTGQVIWGEQALDNLISTGRLLSGLIVAVGAGIALVAFVRRLPFQRSVRFLALVLTVFLGIMTVRTAWMASYINYDTAKEFLVYAHGATGTKQVMEQIEDISLRMHGDLGIRVAFDNEVSWPFWWYLRNYPNKVYFGENPSRDSFESPVVVVGDKNWAKVEPYAGNRFHTFEYTYLWWPMEDYKDLTWERIRTAVGNPEMRAALWDILVNRDYARYGQVVGRDFSLAAWPLRNRMRLYIRKDVAAQLWDYGVGPSIADYTVVDPYEENFQPDVLPVAIIGQSGVGEEGDLQTPRGLSIGPDGFLYVVDSTAHKVLVFRANGQLVRSWGGYCNLAEGTGACANSDGAGQFNEPWGIDVAPDGTVYVADTWNHRIQRFSPEGEFLGAWGRFGQAGVDPAVDRLLFYGPRDVAIGPGGRVYVTDTGNKRVVVFEPEGVYVGEFGEGGPFEGQFDEQVGIDFGPDGLLYVADTWNGRVQVFDEGLNFQRTWAVEAWYGQSVNNKPYIAVDARGQVYVTDPEMYRVLAFDANGKYLFGFGRYSTGLDGMALPVGIDVDEQGIVYVADADNGRVLGYVPGR